MSGKIALEYKLNSIMDAQTDKGAQAADAGIIAECSDALLRMDSMRRYMLTAEEYRGSIAEIFGEPAKKHRLGKKAKIILIAAAILLLLATAATAYGSHLFELIESEKGVIVKTEKGGGRLKEDLTVGYVPDNFILVDHYRDSFTESKKYEDRENYIEISKYSQYDQIEYDNEHGETHIVEQNGRTYIISGEEGKSLLIIWFSDGYMYDSVSSISEEKSLMILNSVQ